MRFTSGLATAASVVAVVAATAAWSQEKAATGAEIQGAIAGKTVQGSMEASGAYTEFYGSDGTIRGDGYTGAWTIEGDAMCFAYGADKPTCFTVAVSGDQVTWIEDGKPTGTGTIVEGNPNNY